jgi:AcrR family transcriptional regulator
LFFRYGIKSLTMDDLARELGISKKTLYQFVDNKEDLVTKVVEKNIREDIHNCKVWADEAEDAVDEILIVLKNIQLEFQRMTHNLVYDLQRYHRDAWDKMLEHQHGFMLRLVHANLERGRREGLYRTDFNVDIVAKLHIAQTFQFFDDSLFPPTEYPREFVFREYILHYLHGLLSDKGRERLQAKLS